MQISKGTIIEGRYTVESLLGQGGMAQVYLVRHNQLGSFHALKVLTINAPSIRQRLIQEGRVQSSLRHPNVVSVTDLVDVDGSPGLIMEYVCGPSLQQLLAIHRTTIDQADRLARGILKGVAAAHNHGLVHRDLKPANILLARQNGELVPKISDFGLVKVLTSDDSKKHQTKAGAVLGTPAYMAPEQIKDSSQVDARSDIFSLGTLLYEILTGSQPFDSDDRMDVFQRICDARYTPPQDLIPEAPDRMVIALNQALQVEIVDRIESVDEMARIWSSNVPLDSLDSDLNDDSRWSPNIAELFQDRESRESMGNLPVSFNQSTISGSLFDSANIEGTTESIPPLQSHATRWRGKTGKAAIIIMLAIVILAVISLAIEKPELFEFDSEFTTQHSSTITPGLLVFEVPNETSQSRFIEARRAFRDTQFQQTIRMCDRLIENHPEEPAPRMLKVMATSFSSRSGGSTVSQLETVKNLDKSEHPTVQFATVWFDSIHQSARSLEAKTHLLGWLDNQPFDYDVMVTVWAVYNGLPDYHQAGTQAHKQKQKVIRTGANNALTYLALAMAADNIDNPEEDEEILRQQFDEAITNGIGVANDPNSLLLFKGQDQQNRGEMDEARQTFQQIVTRDPSHTEARIALVMRLLYNGDEAALQEHTDFFISSTSSPETRANFAEHYGGALYTLGRSTESMEWFQRQIDSSFEDNALTQAFNTLAGAQIMMLHLQDLQQYEHASKVFKEGLIHPGLDQQTRQGMIQCKVAIDGMHAAIIGDTETAQKKMDILDGIPEKDLVFLKIRQAKLMIQPRLLASLGQWQDLHDLIEEEMPTKCGNIHQVLFLGEAKYHTEGVEKAIDYLSEPLPEWCDEAHEFLVLPQYPLLLSRLATMQWEAGQFNEALSTVQRFDQFWPKPDSHLPAVVEIERIRRQGK